MNMTFTKTLIAVVLSSTAALVSAADLSLQADTNGAVQTRASANNTQLEGNLSGSVNTNTASQQSTTEPANDATATDTATDSSLNLADAGDLLVETADGAVIDLAADAGASLVSTITSSTRNGSLNDTVTSATQLASTVTGAISTGNFTDTANSLVGTPVTGLSDSLQGANLAGQANAVTTTLNTLQLDTVTDSLNLESDTQASGNVVGNLTAGLLP